MTVTALILAEVMTLWLVSGCAGSTQGLDALRTEPGSTAMVAVARHETSALWIDLTAGSYFELTLDQPRAAVAAYLYRPGSPGGDDRANWLTVSQPSGEIAGTQRLWAVVETTGRHRLELRVVENSDPSTVRLQVLTNSPATDEQRLHAEAQEAFLVSRRVDEADTGATPTDIWRGSMESAQRAAEMARDLGDPVLEATALNGVSLGALWLGDPNLALDTAERSEPLLREIETPFFLARNLFYQSFVDKLSERAEEARDELAEVIFAARSAKDGTTEADALALQCQTLGTLGFYEQAIGYCHEALHIRERMGIPEYVVTPLIEMATTARVLGHFNLAFDATQRAEEILDSLETDMPRLRLVNLMTQASLFRTLGQPEEAIRHLLTAIQLIPAEQRSPPNNLRYIDLLSLIGNAYLHLDELAFAEHYFNRSLDENSAGTRRLKELKASALAGLVFIRLKQGRNDDADSLIQQTQELLDLLGQSPVIARDMGLARARLTLARDQPQLALEHLESAERELREHFDLSFHLYLTLQEARSHRKLGDFLSAHRAIDSALAAAKELRNPIEFAGCWYERAVTHAEAGDLDLAIEAIDRAIGYVEQSLPAMGREKYQTMFRSSRHKYYELRVQLLMRKASLNPQSNFAREAFLANEVGRRRIFFDALTSGLKSRKAFRSDTLDLDRQSSQAELNRLVLHRESLLREGPSTSSSATELDEVNLHIERVLMKIRGTSETTTSESTPADDFLPSVEVIQREVLDPESLLVSISLGDEQSYLWALTREDFYSLELPPREIIESLAAELLAAIKAAPFSDEAEAGDERMRTRFIDASNALGQMLFGELPPTLLLETRRIVLIVDSALQQVPFAALGHPAGVEDGWRPLVRHHEVISIPSLAFLRHQRLERRSESTTRVPGTRVAIFADPVYQPNDPRMAREVAADRSSREAIDLEAPIRETLRTYGRLLFSREESSRIRQLVGADNSLLFSGFDADRNHVLTSKLESFPIVHFATHATIDLQNPELSGLVLSLFDRQGRWRPDGFLRFHDLAQMRLNADLVVLSACETAIGRQARGEGLLGLSRALFYAGADRVLASLWRIEDAATAQLMDRFYQGLIAEGRAPADALRQAQLAMLETPGKELPYYWAGFVLQGDWEY